MHTAIFHLASILGAGTEPAYSDLAARIRDHAGALGFLPPRSYLDLVTWFGFGYWQEFWYLLDPLLEPIWSSPALDLSGANPLSAERCIRPFVPSYPHPIFPEPEGVLPWAGTDNGGRFFWLTIGDPDTWPTVYYPDRGPEHRLIELDCASITHQLVTGALPLFRQAFGSGYVYGERTSYQWPGAA